MKLHTLLVLLALWLCCIGCDSSSLESMSKEKINEIMFHVDENDPLFTQKNVEFDSIVTYAGYRQSADGHQDRMKIKLYYYRERTRGYYNLSDRDEKNLQVFGKKVNDLWAITCVTKLNMEEVGGYLIWTDPESGIWSNGHHDFKKGTLSVKKQNIDYGDLKSW